jgi:hypothetical protein
MRAEPSTCCRHYTLGKKLDKDYIGWSCCYWFGEKKAWSSWRSGAHAQPHTAPPSPKTPLWLVIRLNILVKNENM